MFGQKKIIKIIDRKNNQVLEEQVFGDNAMKFSYGTKFGKILSTKILSKQIISSLAGNYYDSKLSKNKIKNFINKFDINTNECLSNIENYTSFNDFFARKLKNNARPINNENNSLVSPGDGRLLIFDKINNDTISYVKWAPIKLFDILGQQTNLVKRYTEGSCIILRLCPLDYHRFHFPYSGVVENTIVVDGVFHSVNPYALEEKINVYCLNKRAITEIEYDKNKKYLYMEVGAMMVGSIVQTYETHKMVQKGDEKGYFKFGGSTIILFFEKNAVNYDDDLIKNTNNQLETLVKMGEKIGIMY